MRFSVIQRCFHSSSRTFRPVERDRFKLPADPTSTTYRGKLFEWQTLNAFETIGMQLRHIGGRSDGGIDLKGQWTLILNATDDDNSNNNIMDHEGEDVTTLMTATPDNDSKQNDILLQQDDDDDDGDDNRVIPVVVQCKNVKSGCSPDHLRGLLGATVGLNSERRTLGILASASPKTFTPDTMTLFNSSTLPLGLARVTGEAVLEALVLNHVAQQWLGIQILPRFDALGQPVSPPLIITGNGRVLPSLPPSPTAAAPAATTPTVITTTTTTATTNRVDN